MSESRRAVSVKFPGTRGGVYDYWCHFDVKPRDLVVVETRRGEATVEVVEVKDHSDLAEKAILRRAVKEVDY